MEKVRIIDDLTWESKNYKDGEIREFYQNKELKGTAELKGKVLEFNFDDPSILFLNYKERDMPLASDLLKTPKEINVIIKIKG